MKVCAPAARISGAIAAHTVESLPNPASNATVIGPAPCLSTQICWPSIGIATCAHTGGGGGGGGDEGAGGWPQAMRNAARASCFMAVVPRSSVRRRGLRGAGDSIDDAVMIDHTGIGVSDVARLAAFYDAALGALGLRRVAQLPPDTGADAVGYGTVFPIFWIDRFHPHGVKNHTAFAAPTRAAVDAFHAAAIAAGGTDHGAPGVRDPATGYPPGYYAAFVLDPDGNNIEVVDHHR
jgi:catechol 2,3-dioxygenase-like lactoylglutathione lyase family enzyme